MKQPKIRLENWFVVFHADFCLYLVRNKILQHLVKISSDLIFSLRFINHWLVEVNIHLPSACWPCFPSSWWRWWWRRPLGRSWQTWDKVDSLIGDHQTSAGACSTWPPLTRPLPCWGSGPIYSCPPQAGVCIWSQRWLSFGS